MKQTPCEKRGWKVGDRFVVKRSLGEYGSFYKAGDTARLAGDDGSTNPEFYNERTGNHCHITLSFLKPLPNNPFHKLTKAAKSAKKLDKELARLNKLLPDGFEIVRKSSEPAEDMSDWRNWRAGDILECISQPDRHSEFWYAVGRTYSITGINKDMSLSHKLQIKSNEACSLSNHPGDFRFHSRPVQS